MLGRFGTLADRSQSEREIPMHGRVVRLNLESRFHPFDGLRLPTLLMIHNTQQMQRLNVIGLRAQYLAINVCCDINLPRLMPPNGLVHELRKIRTHR